MNRTNRDHWLPDSGAPARAGSTWAEFIAANRLLLVFSLLFLAGVLIGVMVFALSRTLLAGELSVLLDIHSVSGDVQGGMSALFSSSFSTILLLALLFLFGLSACGAPFSVIVPFFFGMGLGLTEAYYYNAMGLKGIAAVGLLVAPHYLLGAVALVLGSIESIRMSLLLSRQLLPSGVLGGLWADFKIYCARFVLFLGLAFASGVVDVVMRLIFGRLFQ